MRQWADDVNEFLGSIRGVKRALASNVAMRRYLKAVIAERREAPARADLLGGLLAAEVDGARLTDDELLATIILLFNAGHHTTMNLLGNGLLALLRHPAELARLRADPSLVPSAVEELLRYDSPVQHTGRIALEDLDVGGTRIERGRLVFLMLGAANRDPAAFPDPDALDVTRNAARHVAFGLGIHFCVGAPLTRLEAPIALAALLRRFPRLRLDGGPLVWNPNPTLRGLQSLPVAIDAG
jgi:cytochrome P450